MRVSSITDADSWFTIVGFQEPAAYVRSYFIGGCQVPFSFSCFFKKFMKGIFICPVQCCFYLRKAFCKTVDFKKQVFTVGKE